MIEEWIQTIGAFLGIFSFIILWVLKLSGSFKDGQYEGGKHEN